MGSFAVLLPELLGAVLWRIGLMVRCLCLMHYTDQTKFLFQESFLIGLLLFLLLGSFALLCFALVFGCVFILGEGTTHCLKREIIACGFGLCMR